MWSDYTNGEEINLRKKNNTSNALSHNIFTNQFMIQ